MEEEDIIRDIGDCDGIIVRLSKCPTAFFEAAKKLKVVARHGAGLRYREIWSPRQTSWRCGIKCPIANSMSVAELTIILYAALLARNFKLVEEKCLKIITGQNCAPES